LPLDALAAELGADVSRMERELRLEMRAALAEAELRFRALEQRIAEQAAQLAATPGPVGPPGRDGESIAGPPGPAGPPGLLPAVTEWRAGVHYADAVVGHTGSLWQAIRDTGTTPPSEDWQVLAAAGADGSNGRSLAFRGAWKGGRDYGYLDVVAHDGGSWVALQDAPGPCPGDGWQLLAARGKAGPPGARGERGERGYPGPAAPAPQSLAVDEAGILTLTLADGSTLSADFYPLLVRAI
jgi:hypothetical protein